GGQNAGRGGRNPRVPARRNSRVLRRNVLAWPLRAARMWRTSVNALSDPSHSESVSMTLSVTRLLGLHLTPGKLRGLQRICNDNGTLTMVATDQNSSMISMFKDSFKTLEGKEREPTYDE